MTQNSKCSRSNSSIGAFQKARQQTPVRQTSRLNAPQNLQPNGIAFLIAEFRGLQPRQKFRDNVLTALTQDLLRSLPLKPVCRTK
ncbi:MAG: hypothetical protein ACK58T_07025, partial [Phycisphaerae bacterium]